MNKMDLLQRLRDTEETLLLELLEITSDELVDRFLDKIEDKFEYINGQYEEENTFI